MFMVLVEASTHVTPYRRELGWLRVEGRRDYFMACLLFKILRTFKPSYLAEFFVARQGSRPVRTGCTAALLVPSCRTEALRGSFHVSATILWNSLPLNIQSASSINHFKSLLKKHLFILPREQ